MAEKRENSVLFSLRELRTIEEERIKEEHDAAQRAEQDRIRQQMEAEERARQEAEAKRRAAEDAERREREERERLAREERMRVEAEAQRAHVEAQAALERDRLAKEMEIRAIEASKKRPVFLVTISLVMLAFVAIAGYWAYSKAQENEAIEIANKKRIAEFQAKVEKSEKNIDELIAEKDAAVAKLLEAKTAEEKADAERQRKLAEKKLAAEREHLKKLREIEAKKAARRKEYNKRIHTKCDPNDPLCGI